MLDRDRIFALELKASSGRRSVMEDDRLQQKRNITQTGNRTTIDLETFRPFELAINKWHVHLQCESAVHVVTGDKLRNRAVQVLPGRICDFAPIHLNGRKTSELFADCTVPPGQPGKKMVDSIPGMALSWGV